MNSTQAKVDPKVDSKIDPNIDQAELNKFGDIAHKWWDTEGEFKPLHDMNPLRADYIERHAGLAGKRVLDIGCGGGILAEAMTVRGAEVIGLDMVESSLEVARLHSLESGVKVEYVKVTAEDYAQQQAASFDVVTCLEMLEHVPDPASVVRACAALVKPGGHVFFSTINRNPKSFAMAIIGAEYILNLLPRGTHHYEKFIRPSELSSWARAEQLELDDLSGIRFNPFNKRFSLEDNVDVNYIMHCQKAED